MSWSAIAFYERSAFSIYQYPVMSISNVNVILDYIIDVDVHEIFLFRNYIIQDTRETRHRGIAFFLKIY